MEIDYNIYNFQSSVKEGYNPLMVLSNIMMFSPFERFKIIKQTTNQNYKFSSILYDIRVKEGLPGVYRGCMSNFLMFFAYSLIPNSNLIDLENNFKMINDRSVDLNLIRENVYGAYLGLRTIINPIAVSKVNISKIYHPVTSIQVTNLFS